MNGTFPKGMYLILYTYRLVCTKIILNSESNVPLFVLIHFDQRLMLYNTVYNLTYVPVLPESESTEEKQEETMLEIMCEFKK